MNKRRVAVRVSAAVALMATTLAAMPFSNPMRVNAQTPHRVMTCNPNESLFSNDGYIGLTLHLDHCGGNASVDVYYVNGHGPTSQDVLQATLSLGDRYPYGAVAAQVRSPGGASSLHYS